MAEIFSLGVRPRKRPPKEKVKKPRKRARKKKKRSVSRRRLLPIPSPTTPNLSVQQSCESSPVELDLMPLKTLLTSPVARLPLGGFDSENVKKRKAKAHIYKGGNEVRPPARTYSVGDMATYLNVPRLAITRVAGMLGYLKRLSGRYMYAPFSETQAKALIQHFRLRSARLLMKNGRLAKEARSKK